MLLSLCTLILVFINPRMAHGADAPSFVDPMRHEIVTITPRSFSSLISKYRNSDGVAVLLQYSSSRDSDRKVIDNVYNVAAKDLKGMVRMGAIDCSESLSFCEEYDANYRDRKRPVAIVFPPAPLPHLLVEELKVESIKKAALRYIPGNNVKGVAADNLDTFLNQDPAIPKVLLYSSKEHAPVLFRALSNAFKDRMYFGFVKPGETAVEKKFKVKQRPHLLLLSSSGKQSTGAGVPDVYKGQMRYQDIYDWLNVKAETFVKGGGFSESGRSNAKNPASKPWLTESIPEMTGPSHQDICFRDGDALCAVLLSCGAISPADQNLLEGFKAKYGSSGGGRGADFKFMWLDVCRENSWREMLRLANDPTKLPGFVIINPHKRYRYVLYDNAEKAVDRDSLEQLLDKVAAGTTFTRIKNNKLPTFAVGEPHFWSS